MPLSLWDFAIFTNLSVFLVLWIFIMFIIGLFSGRMAIGTMSGFMTFVYIAQSADIELFTNTLYIILVLITVGMGTQIWEWTAGDM